MSTKVALTNAHSAVPNARQCHRRLAPRRDIADRPNSAEENAREASQVLGQGTSAGNAQEYPGRKIMTDHNSNGDRTKGGLTRRSVLLAGAGLAAGSAMLPPMFTPVFAADQPPLGTWPEGSKGDTRHHRRRGAAHRRLRGPGRRRTQGHAACRRAHQRRQRADQEDRAQGLEGRARQAGEAGRRQLRAPSRTTPCRSSSASSTRTRSSR